MKTRKQYPDEFKQEAVQLSYSSGKTVGQQARDLGITEGQLHVWRREVRERGGHAFPGQGKARDAELVEWKRRAQRAEMERDILKHILGWTAIQVAAGWQGQRLETPNFKMGAMHPLL